jgi:hypothetical protein
MIWRDTTHVGMAFAVSGSGWKYVVARYSPPLASSGVGVQTPAPIPAPPPAQIPTPIPAPIFPQIPAQVPAPPPAPTPIPIPAPTFTRVPAQVSTQIITQTRAEQSVQSTTHINSNWEPPAGNNHELVSQYQPIPGPGPWTYNNYPMPPFSPNPMGPQMFPDPSGPPPPPLTGSDGPLVTGPVVAPPFATPLVNFPPAPRPPGN